MTVRRQVRELPTSNQNLAMTTTTTTTTSISTPSPSSSNDSGSTVMSQGANYFFGFLITFILLLLIFVACGVGSRRRLGFARQIGILGEGRNWDLMTNSQGEQLEPTFSEAWLVDGDTKWSAMMPLSAAMIRKKPAPTSHEPTSSIQNQYQEYRVPPRNRHFFRPFVKPPRDGDGSQNVDVYLPEAIEIAVLICMPTTPLQDQQFKEYEIGVMRAPWHEDVHS